MFLFRLQSPLARTHIDGSISGLQRERLTSLCIFHTPFYFSFSPKEGHDAAPAGFIVINYSDIVPAEHLSSTGSFEEGALLEHLKFTGHFWGGAGGGAGGGAMSHDSIVPPTYKLIHTIRTSS